MRLSFNVLSTSSTVNQFSVIPFLSIAPGESTSLIFQLYDAETGLRYIPAAGATVQVSIPRTPTVTPDPTYQYNQRVTTDYSINRPATPAFSGDTSIWMLPLIPQDTLNLISSNVTVTVTEGQKVSIATVTQAIKMIGNQDR